MHKRRGVARRDLLCPGAISDKGARLDLGICGESFRLRRQRNFVGHGGQSRELCGAGSDRGCEVVFGVGRERGVLAAEFGAGARALKRQRRPDRVRCRQRGVRWLMWDL